LSNIDRFLEYGNARRVATEIVRVVGCYSSFLKTRKEVIIMETFLEIIREIAKGVVKLFSLFLYNH
jgi:hypothetical protein